MHSTSKKQNKTRIHFIWSCCFFMAFLLAGTHFSAAQDNGNTGKEQARVTGLRYISIHVLQLEKSLKLYQEILGFKMDDAEVLKAPGIEGMVVLKLKADDLTIALSVTAPQHMGGLQPIGNTNHNHFMLVVNDIGPIGDKLKEEGYALENDNYVQDKYTFFTGPNGEIIGLSSWD